MQGDMMQWLGYIYGYNKRYFRLEHSTLAIYNTKEEYNEGKPCIENVNIPLCEIVRNTTENLQLEIRKSDGGWIYLRTEEEGDRQSWLKALGTAKACMLDATGIEYFSQSQFTRSTSSISGNDDSNHTISSEESEIYVVDTEDVKNLENGAIEDYQNTLQPPPTEEVQGNSQEQTDLTNNNDQKIKEVCSTLKRQISAIEDQFSTDGTISKAAITTQLEDCSNQFEKLKLYILKLNQNKEEVSQSNTEEQHEQQRQQEEKHKKSEMTYFSSNKVDFEEVLRTATVNSETCIENGIETGLFLEACDKFLAMYDLFGGTMFQPLKADVSGNIEKIRKAYHSNRDQYHLMKDIYYGEEFLKAKDDDGGPIVGLTWLLRGMETMAVFLQNLFGADGVHYKQGVAAMDHAYQNTIMKYHNFVLKRMFRMGIKMCPTYETISIGLTKDGYKDVENIHDILDSEAVHYANSIFNIIETAGKFISA